MLNTSFLLPQAGARWCAAVLPCFFDAEAVRVCGDGPFSSIAPSSFLEMNALTHTTLRHRSQSISSPRERQGSPSSPDAHRSVQRMQPFPHPSKSQITRALKRVLTEETKTLVYDYIEVEELLSGQPWDDEDE